MKKLLTYLSIVALASITLAGCSKDVSANGGAANYFTVTFESNGGSEVEPQSVEEGSTATSPIAPTMDGYFFAGWYSDKELESKFDFTTPIYEDVSLYAMWSEDIEDGEEEEKEEDDEQKEPEPVKTATVTFESNGGSKVDSQSVEVEALAIKPENPTKDGYIFMGWYSDEEFTSEYDFNDAVTDDITLYAQWYIYVEGAYYISNAEELAAFRDDVNSGSATTATAFLVKDIDLSAIESWAPIGSTSSYPFRGVFDGNGHTISNMKISEDVQYAALFGYVYNGVTISNVKLKDCAVNIQSSSAVCAAGICGYSYGSNTFSNCYVSGGSISVNTSSSAWAAGVVGCVTKGATTITSCYNTSNVYATSSMSASNTLAVVSCGGVTAIVLSSASVAITNCFNTGDISANYRNYSTAGGILGFFFVDSEYTKKITNCYNRGAVSSTANVVYYSSAGGIVGYAAGNYGSISNCYNTGSYTVYPATTQYVYRGAIVGYGTPSTTNTYTTANKTEAFISSLNGTSGSEWVFDADNVNDGYPILSSLNYN